MVSGPLRVAILAESYLPYLSGVTVSTDALARGLGAAGHEVLVVAPAPGHGRSPGSAGSPGSEPRFAWLPSYQMPWLVPEGFRMPIPLLGSRALAEALAFAPHVVHAQSPFVSGVLAARLARRCGAPLVFTHHTRFADYGHYLGPFARPGSAVIRGHLRRFWAGCAAIVAPSTDLADEIAGRLPAGRGPIVRTIPTGVDVGAIRALPTINPRPAAGWPADSRVIASLGRLAPEKSVGTVIDAFARLAPGDQRLRLLLIGDGPSQVALEARVAQQGLQSRVHFAGKRPRLEALALLKGAELFAFASRTETQGLVLAEALTCGLPVIAIEGPGVRDSVRDGRDGIVVPDASAAAVASAMGRLLADDERRAALAGAASRDADRFDLRVRVAQVEALYRELLT